MNKIKEIYEMPIIQSFLHFFGWRRICVFSLVAVVMIFIYVSFSSRCRGLESLYIFILSVFALIPFNLRLSLLCSQLYGFYFETHFFKYILVYLLSFFVLYDVEEIILGIVGRLIWKE